MCTDVMTRRILDMFKLIYYMIYVYGCLYLIVVLQYEYRGVNRSVREATSTFCRKGTLPHCVTSCPTCKFALGQCSSARDAAKFKFNLILSL